MNSLDTNLLFYALNKDCPEHPVCAHLVAEALQTPEKWIIADQVWFELYRLLRNGKLLQFPLSSEEADRAIGYYRDRSGWGRCAWEPSLMNKLRQDWRASSFPPRRTFDLILAHTLKAHGVVEFYTRNRKDFESYGFFRVTNPLTEPPN